MRQPVQELIERYQKNLYAAAFNICKNQMDAEDVVQETFVQYYTIKKEFENERHIRAWLLRVAINKAKNLSMTFWKKHKCSLEDYMETLQMPEPEHRGMLNAVMALPTKYRMILYLYYYEGYATAEIAEFLQVPNGTVRTRLARGREQLKKILKEAE